MKWLSALSTRIFEGSPSHRARVKQESVVHILNALTGDAFPDHHWVAMVGTRPKDTIYLLMGRKDFVLTSGLSLSSEIPVRTFDPVYSTLIRNGIKESLRMTYNPVTQMSIGSHSVFQSHTHMRPRIENADLEFLQANYGKLKAAIDKTKTVWKLPPDASGASRQTL